jgi:enterochelin esterase-like enzyme
MREIYGYSGRKKSWELGLFCLFVLTAGAVGCNGDSVHSPPLPTLAATIALPAPAASIAATVTPTPVETPATISVATATPCAAAGRVERHTFHSPTMGGPTAYQIYWPPCYDLVESGAENGRYYPTLYLLPGNIHDEQIWADLGIGEAAEVAIRDRVIPPLLIVMPDGGWLAQNSSGGPGSYESFILDDLIPHIEQTTCAWPEAAGRAIGGLSRGGYWALGIAFRHPQQFASVGGHSAALLDTHAGPDLNPQYTGLSHDLGHLRIYLDIGAEDYVIHNVRRLHQEMTAAGVEHTWVLNDGRHEEAYWSAHLTGYLRWYTMPWPQERAAYPPCFP